MPIFANKLVRVRRFLRQVAHLSLPYFRSDERWLARGMLAAIIALTLGSVHMLVLLNSWRQTFYNALQKMDQPLFWQLLGRFSYLAAIYITIGVCLYFLTQRLELRWRAWMTRDLMSRWLARKTFYRIELGRYAGVSEQAMTESGLPEPGQRVPDNPDQRLQEDVNQFTQQSIELTMGFLNAVVTLVSFAGILWSLSGSITVHGVAIPGFMVWMALLYCIAGTTLTHLIGRPLIGLNFEQQKREADFRYHMVRVREYSEAIALDQGEAVEGKRLDGRLGAVLSNYLALIVKQTQLMTFTNLFGQAAVVFPYIIAAPRYFAGAFQLGGLMQTADAFGRVQDALSWFINNYAGTPPNLTAWRATTERLTSFEAALSPRPAQPAPAIETQAPGQQSAPVSGLSVQGLTVQLPAGQTLLQDVRLSAAPGQHTLIQGASGSGKSTLLRALAGIWPWASGTVALPPATMVIPQRPYFPDGALRDALAYPEDARRYGDDELRRALTEARLPQLAERLDERDHWTQKLSGGELQRLAIARVLLKRPAWVLADEATSALDPPTGRQLIERLRQLTASAGGALISVAHDSSQTALHRQTWTFMPDADSPAASAGARAAWQIRTQALPS